MALPPPLAPPLGPSSALLRRPSAFLAASSTATTSTSSSSAFPSSSSSSRGINRRISSSSGRSSIRPMEMEVDNELEEGEAYGDDDDNEQDSDCDPDTAYSYLDERIQVILGDVKKDFEGRLSADKLGSKYGGYGSFLPTYERPPSYLSQPRAQSKAPVTSANDAITGNKFPDEGPVERIRHNAASTALVSKPDKLRGRVGPLPVAAIATNNSETMEDEGRPNLAAKESPLVDQKKVTLRIKMGAARTKNSELYNGLGLDNSSSVSMDDDSDEDQRSLSGLGSSPERSPLSMIQRMISHRIPGRSLLSPMHASLLELKREAVPSPPMKAHKQRKPSIKEIEEAVKLPPLIDRRKDMVIAQEKIEKKTEETKELLVNEVWSKSPKKKKKWDTDRSLKESSQTKLKLSTNLLSTGKEEPLSYSYDNSLEVLQRDMPKEKASKFFDTVAPIKEKGSPICNIKYDGYDSFQATSKPHRTQTQESIKASSSSEHIGEKVKDVVAAGENTHEGKMLKEAKQAEKEDRRGIDGKESSTMYIERKFVDGDAVRQAVKNKVKAGSSEQFGTEKALEPEPSSETRKKLKFTVEKVVKPLKDVSSKVKVKDSSLHESRRESKGERNMKSPWLKDHHRKSDKFREGRKEAPKAAGNNNNSNNNNKEAFREYSKNDIMAEGSIESWRKESKGKEFSHKDNPRLFEAERDQEAAMELICKPICKPHTNTGVSARDTGYGGPMGLDAPQTDGIASTAPTATTTATGVVITEDWVQCDKCETWRLLPPGIKPEVLPKQWRCKMLTWLVGMNSCKYTEEQTTQAVYARYVALPPPEPATLGAAQALNGLPTHEKPEPLNHQMEFEKYDSVMNKRNWKILPGSVKPSQTPTNVGSLKNKISTDVGKASEERAQGLTEERRKAKEKEKLKRLRASDGDILQMPKKRPKAHSPRRSLDAEMDASSDQSGSSRRMKISHGLHERTNHDRILEDPVRDTGKVPSNDLVGRSERISHSAKVRESDAASKCVPRQTTATTRSDGLQESNDERAASNPDHIEGHVDRHANGKFREADTSSDRFKDRDGRDGRYDRQSGLEKVSREPDEEQKRDKGPTAVYPIDDHSKGKEKRDDRLKFPSHDARETTSRSLHGRQEASPATQEEAHAIRDASGHDQRQQIWPEAKKRKNEMSKKNERDNERTRTLTENSIDLVINRHPPVLLFTSKDGKGEREDRGTSTSKDGRGEREDRGTSTSKDGRGEREDRGTSTSKDGRGEREDRGTSTSKEGRGGEREDKGISTLKDGREERSNLILKSSHTRVSKNSEKLQNVSQSVDPIRAKLPKEQADGAMVATKSSGVSNLHNGRDETGHTTSIHSEATHVIQEAKNLKHCADRLKISESSGRLNGSTDMYFHACLKYLHAASMLEPLNAESAKLGENTQSISVYTETAKLCEFCAYTYERTRALAAAALAYKCAGLAHMRVVTAKTTCATRDRAELVAAYHQIPPGESPSSSLDVDNLCHQAQAADKLPSSASTKGRAASPAVPGNHIILARNRPNYDRVLQYVSDVTSAFQAFDKSQSAYALVDRSSTSGEYGPEAIAAVKNVVESSLNDVGNLLRLVRLALEAIRH